MKTGSKNTESECYSDDDVEYGEDFLIIELTDEEDEEKGVTYL